MSCTCGEADFDDDTVKLHFSNTGKSAAVFQVRKGNSADGPWTYTVGPGAHLSDIWTFSEGEAYDLSVFGPNGFVRAFRGILSGRDKANLTVRSRYGEAAASRSTCRTMVRRTRRRGSPTRMASTAPCTRCRRATASSTKRTRGIQRLV